ncbi:MAG: cation transporter, partial [Gemmatimonadota bacterium]
MQLDLPIAGLTCLDCARRVERALRALPGVGQASVDYPTGRATIAVDETTDLATLREAAAAAVQAAGYHVAVDGSETAEGAAAPAVTQAVAPTTAPAADKRPARGSPAHGEAVRTARGVDYDLVIIGSGSAGMAAAIRASELGVRAAIA